MLDTIFAVVVCNLCIPMKLVMFVLTEVYGNYIVLCWIYNMLYLGMKSVSAFVLLLT